MMRHRSRTLCARLGPKRISLRMIFLDFLDFLDFILDFFGYFWIFLDFSEINHEKSHDPPTFWIFFHEDFIFFEKNVFYSILVSIM